MNTYELIDELKKLELSSEPKQEITDLLTQIFQASVPIITTDYNHPKTFDRAVNNTTAEPIFSKKSRISFKPSQFNKTYLRASTPDTTMFYASVIPEEEMDTESIKNARIVGVTETVDILREDTSGERVITFGKWEVQDEISVISIFDPNIDYKSEYVNNMRNEYNSHNDENDDVKKRNCVLEFLASEFSKKVTSGQSYNYMISAIFTELVTQNGVDGVLYPSVQSDGYGLCIALHPQVMSKLKLIKVLQSRLIKNGKDAELINEKFSIIEDDSETFELKEIE